MQIISNAKGDASMYLKLIFRSENLLDCRLKYEDIENEINMVGHRLSFGGTKF